MFKSNNGNISILDCTLRDGGQGIEFFRKQGFDIQGFSENEKNCIINNLVESNIDIIELGCITSDGTSETDISIYERIEDLSKYVPQKKKNNQIVTGLYIDPDTDIEQIPEYKQGQVEGVRVILRYSKLSKSLEFCKALSPKGYKVFVQPMLTMRYSDEELNMVINAANEMQAYALYIVDSFGYMHEHDVERLYNYYAGRLDGAVKIGFHAHNNMSNALSNTMHFIRNVADRECIVDSCALGMGQGAGNLQTELLLYSLMEDLNNQVDYNINRVLDVCDIVGKIRNDNSSWGYSPVRLIAAFHRAAYKYGEVLANEKQYSLSEINNILSCVDDNLRHRYTRENLDYLLKQYEVNKK